MTIEEFKKNIEKGFLSDDVLGKAMEIADLLKGLSLTKMRQYFDDLKGLGRIIDSGASTEQIKVKLHLIRSRAHYDTQRIRKKEKEAMLALKDLLIAGIDDILKSNDVCQHTKEFTIFFENLYGYFYASRPQREEE